jgi:hypothetical protein
MSGYDLKNQAFDNTIAHFWQSDQAQIYRTLATMAEAGWVQSTLEIQHPHPNRKVYHDAGATKFNTRCTGGFFPLARDVLPNVNHNGRI